MSMQQAKVKSVISGTSLTLTSVHNPSQERVLNLAFVTGPRLKKDGDEVKYPPVHCSSHFAKDC